MAAVAAGSMLASAVLKVLTQKIGSSIGRYMQLHWNFSRDLEKMKMTLESVEAVLKDAERRSTKDAAVCLWLLRLKNVMYGISDMIDEFDDDTNTLATMMSKFTMTYKMKKMNEQLKEIIDQHHKFTLKVDHSSNLQPVDVRETSSTVEEAQIIGRTEDKEKLMACLSGITQGITILPIYGIGGIGKTTLAKLIFNDINFKDYTRVWVYVSQTFDLNRIGNSIASQVLEEQSQMIGRQLIHNCLRIALAARKTLIILDDLWEKDPSQLQDLKDMLKIDNGSKVVVIVTTRDEGTAMKIHTLEPYKIEPLTNDMCWDIIKHKSLYETRHDKEQLELIGRDIAKKCGGVALAAQSLGYMLQSMKFDEWASVRENDVWNELTSEDASSPHCLLASLKLSYISMPSYLKLCFAYCSIFPKGHNIVKDNLIHQWISLGFIEPNNILSTWQLGENYVTQLLRMSFLHYSKPPLAHGLQDRDVIVFNMHDLVHDLARSVMAGEVLDGSRQHNIGGSSCRYALLTDCGKQLNLSVISPANIRALCFLDCGSIVLRGAAFSSAKYLRVLDLSACSIQKLPDAIGQLKQLRYLDAPRIQNKMIPKCITKLSKLSYLNLGGSSELAALPEAIGEMKGLMHLNLSYCSGIQSLPKSLADLKDLTHLDLSHCILFSSTLIQALGGLLKLRYLSLSYCTGSFKISKPFKELKELVHLDLSHCSCVYEIQEALCGLSKLQILNLSYCDDPLIGIQKSFPELKELVHLDLSHCSCIDGISEALGVLKKLQFLNLSYGRGLVGLPSSLAKLKELVHLDLSHCNCVDGISEALGGLTKLQYLDLSYCDSLAGLPQVISNLTKLRHVNLSGCMRYIYDPSSECEIASQIEGFIDNIRVLSNLEHLDLSFNDEIHAIPESITSLKKLRTLDLSACYCLDTLPEGMSKMHSNYWISVPMCGDGLAQEEEAVWRHGDVDGRVARQGRNLNICSEDGPVEDGDDDTCVCVRPVCAPDPVCGSAGVSGF